MTELTPHFVLNVVDRLASLVWASPRVSSEGKNEAGGPLGILGRDLDKCRHVCQHGLFDIAMQENGPYSAT